MNKTLKDAVLGVAFFAVTAIAGGCGTNNGLGKTPRLAPKNDVTCGGQTQPKVERSAKGESKINPVYKKTAKAQSQKMKKHRHSAKKQQGNPGFGNKKGFPWIF